ASLERAGVKETDRIAPQIVSREIIHGIDGHQAIEEIRGVNAAGAGGILSREDYQALGVRQSIFAQDQRGKLYDLFEKYRAWLTEAKLFDLNFVA
ncbi:MAG: hypothetical protein ABL860_00830, partial [Candidatus Nitrotoga sp.]